jgi:hypothetical protein
VSEHSLTFEPLLSLSTGECVPEAEPVAAEPPSEITAPVLPVFNDSSFNVEFIPRIRDGDFIKKWIWLKELKKVNQIPIPHFLH